MGIRPETMAPLPTNGTLDVTDRVSMSVGVVLPAYRCGSTIGETLDAVAGQTVTPSAVVVVLDGEDPDLETVVRTHPSGVEVLVNPVNSGGPGIPRDIGVDRLRARGSFDAIWFLDPDDVPDPRFLEMTSEMLERHPSASFAVTGHRNWSDGEPPPPRDRVLDRAPSAIDLDWYLGSTGSLLPSFSLFRLDRLVGLRTPESIFDCSLRVNQDYDLFVRLLHRGVGVRTAWSGGAYRIHGAGISADAVALWLCRLQADEGLARWFDDSGEHDLAARFRRSSGSALRQGARHLWRRNARGDRRSSLRFLFEDAKDRRDPRSLVLALFLLSRIERPPTSRPVS